MWHLWGRRAIAKKLGISRNTVKRYCTGENIPWESKPRNYNSPITDPIRAIVREWLTEDKIYAPKKQHHTAECIYERLVQEKYFNGSPSIMRKLVHELRSEEKQAHISLEFDPGAAA